MTTWKGCTAESSLHPEIRPPCSPLSLRGRARAVSPGQSEPRSPPPARVVSHLPIFQCQRVPRDVQPRAPRSAATRVESRRRGGGGRPGEGPRGERSASSCRCFGGGEPAPLTAIVPEAPHSCSGQDVTPKVLEWTALRRALAAGGTPPEPRPRPRGVLGTERRVRWVPALCTESSLSVTAPELSEDLGLLKSLLSEPGRSLRGSGAVSRGAPRALPGAGASAGARASARSPSLGRRCLKPRLALPAFPREIESKLAQVYLLF